MSIITNIGPNGEVVKSNNPLKFIWDESNTIKCSKCGKIPSGIEYKGKPYCTWYCAKKVK